MSTEIAPASSTGVTIVRQKPIMSMRNILLMNLGFFGIQYSFGMQQTAINPIFQLIGAKADSLPILNLAGPVTGLLIQPVIGAMSDHTWSEKWGRRKPYFLVGAIGCSLTLAAFPFVGFLPFAVAFAVAFMWILDMSNNTAMDPYRAFIADRLPPSQIAKGFLAQSFFAGFGITAANLSLYLFQKLMPGEGSGGGLPGWVYGCFFVGSVASIATVLISIKSTPELPPSPAELEMMRKEKKGAKTALLEIKDAIVEMPVQLRKLALVYLFQWYAMNCYWQFVSLTVGRSAFGVTDPTVQKTEYSSAVGWTGLINGFYNIVTFCVSFSLVGLARKHGAKWVHIGCLLLATVGLLIFPHVTNKYAMFLPIIGLGIAWASILGVPYIMAVRMVPSTRYGVYMGILNMMIVIPMLIQTLTFGWVYKHLLGDTPSMAITFAGVFLGIAALAMLWIKEPPIVRDVDEVGTEVPESLAREA